MSVPEIEARRGSGTHPHNTLNPSSDTLMRESAIRFVSTVLILVVTQASGILIARTLGAEGKGLHSVVGLVSTLALIPADLGLSAATIYMIGRQRVGTQALLSALLPVGAIGALTIAGALWTSSTFLSGVLFDGAYASTIALLAFGLPATLISGWFMGMLRGHNRILTVIVIQLLAALIATGVLCICLFALRLDEDSIAWSLNASGICGLFMSAMSLRQQGLRFIPRFNQRALREAVSYGIRSQLGTILQMVNYRFDLLVANALLGTAAAGVYGVAAGITGLLWQVPNAFGFILLSRSAAATNTDAAQMSVTAARVSFWIVFVASMALIPLGFGVVPLVFGPEFANVGWPIVGLTAGVVMLSYYKVLGSYLSARGRPELTSYAAGLSAIVTVGLDFLLMPRWGIMGAAIASSVAYTTAAALTIWWFRRMAGSGSLQDLFFPRLSDARLVWSLVASRVAMRKS